MQPELEKIREQQKESWTKFAPGWKKWDDMVMDFLQPMGDAIINSLKLKDTDTVLDIAGGTGEPGLTIASIVKNGKVIITDLSESMIDIVRENALKRGIKNIETQACDVSELPFADNSFDAVSCRFGFMFFPDMMMALKEIVRVLKPGGRFATTVWSVPEKNFWITATTSVINKNMDLAAPPAGSPGIFRCAKEGFMTALFQQAGFINIDEAEVNSKLDCGTIDTYWTFTTEVGAPVVAALSKADDATKDKIKKEVYQLLNEKYPDGNISIPSAARVICGEK